MKRMKASPKLVISWILRRHSSCFLCLRGFLLSLHQALVLLGDRESSRFNGDGGTTRKPIIHGIRSLHFCTEALNGFDIPWWITTTKWEGERERWGGARKAGNRDREPGRNSFALAPLGLERVGGVLCAFFGKCSSSLHTHASLSSQMKSQRRSSFSLVHSWCALEQHTSS